MRYTRSVTVTLALAGVGLISGGMSSPAAAQRRGSSDVVVVQPRVIDDGSGRRNDRDARDDRDDDDGRNDRDRRGSRDARDARDRRDDDDRWRRVCDDRGRRSRDCDWEDARCVDRDRDGWCDYAERRPVVCSDRDRDARCDYAERRYPSSLPKMVWAIDFERGRHTDRARQWVGAGQVRAQYAWAGRNRAPGQVTWIDSRGLVVQRWVDDDRDGRADRVAIYRDGRIIRVIR